MGADSLLALSATALLGTAGAAVTPGPPPRLAGEPLSAPELSAEEARVERLWVRRLSETYDAAPELVASLRGLGLDRIDTECAVAVSTRAQRPIGEVLLLRRAGMPWSEIAHSYGFGLLEAIRPPPEARTKNTLPALER
ncbi:MAG: hypothetical protein HY928_12230 [Elusimicrobia bacterium]|nr:hypothetical protein [Elusimicrobiota bacterium]